MQPTFINKYNVPGPRYTSYPTVPYWDSETFSSKAWVISFQNAFRESNLTEGISVYIHLPFCESLCTFCGCHKRITKRHEVERPYIDAVLKEWKLYCRLLGHTPKIKELHLGGGTPTFFSAENLKMLVNGIFSYAHKCDTAEFSFEGHPNNTSKEHLEALFEVGFKRVSYGVQDYSQKVQMAINRIQPYENVKKATLSAREIGYSSVGHDLVFGLPYQSEGDVVETINKTIPLMPDRIAFYSYAHVPWLKGNGQRGYSEKSLPTAEEKRKLYETGKSLLAELGYREIGMDHFALPTDALYSSMLNGTLHRNFMGYTASKTKLMIGLGISAISDSWYGFAQNVKGLEEYCYLVENDILPVFRGHILNKEDLIIRSHILNLMCRFETSWNNQELNFDGIERVLKKTEELEADGLIKIENNTLTITEAGKPFVRNICMAFDARLQRSQPETCLFSMTV